MWLLKDSNGKVIYLKPNETLIVGRKKADLLLNDDSVSRKHAEIMLTPKKDIDKIVDKMEPLTTCTINDTGSRYGSTVIKENGTKTQIAKNKLELQHLDKVCFGVQHSIFTVIYVPIITATSGLDEPEKNELQSIIDKIDGRITSVWEKTCTHLTVSKPNISEKLTCALAFGTPIVPIDYWKCVLKAFKANEKLPDSIDFASIINDKLKILGDVSVNPNPARKTLFENLTFIHFDSNQYNVYRRMIVLAGGKSLYRTQLRSDFDICDKNVVIVQLVESNTTQATGSGDANYAAACEKLGECRRRTIPSSEIALAIFHCSTDKWCNPSYDHVDIFKRKIKKCSENLNVLALDTQDVDAPPTTCPRESRVATERQTTKTGESISDYIKESTEESSKIDSESIESICEESSKLKIDTNNRCLFSQMKNLPRPQPSSPQSLSHNDNVESIILRREKNFEKKIHEEIKPKIMGNMGKRDREDDDIIDTKNKKICPEISNDDSCDDKQSITERIYKSHDNTMTDEKIVGIVKKDTELEVNREKSVSLHDAEKLDNDIFQKISKSEDGKLHKRKVDVSRFEPLWDSDSTLKRNKIAQSSTTKLVSPNKHMTEKIGWTPAKRGRQDSTNLFASKKNMSADSEFKTEYCDTKTNILTKTYDPDSSLQLILRVEGILDPTESTVPKFRKKFRKIFGTIPRRIEIDETLDMNLPSIRKNEPKEELSTDEDNA